MTLVMCAGALVVMAVRSLALTLLVVPVCHYLSPLRSRHLAPDGTPVVITEAVALVTLDQKVIRSEFHRHIHLEWNAVHEDQAIHVCQQEPSILVGQIVIDDKTFLEAFIHAKDGIDIVGCCSRS